MAEKTYFVHSSSYVDEGCDDRRGNEDLALFPSHGRLYHWGALQYRAKRGHLSGRQAGGRLQDPEQRLCLHRRGVRGRRVPGAVLRFYQRINPRAFIERKSEYRRTVVKKGASIGANATIVCGHDIGRYAFVGAGSVVTKNVPDYAMVYGSPAKVQGYVCQCGEKLHFAEGKACCTACGKQYHMNDKSAVEELEKI